MPSLGSFAEGAAGMQLDLQNIQLNQFKIAEAPLKLQEEGIKLQQDKIALQQQTRMLSLMQNLKPPQDVNDPNELARVWSDMSMIQLETGQPDAAAKSAAAAYHIQDTASKVDARSYRMQNDRMSKFANVLSSNPDTPAGFAAAIQDIAAADPGIVKNQRFQQIVQEGWAPGKMQSLLRSTLTAKEQAEVDYRRKAGDHAEAAADVDKVRVDLIKAQTRLANDRDTKIKKEGGSTVKAADRNLILNLAKAEYPGADPADLYWRAQRVAENMVKIRQEQHLSDSEAARRAYEDARTHQEFAGLRTAPVAKGTKPGTPLGLPQRTSDMTFEQWKKKLVPNQWYPQGLWTGTEFVSEEEAAKRASGDKALADEEDDEED